MNIQTFIFNWRGQYSKTRAKELQLRAIGVEPVVINSDDTITHEHWHNIGDDSYFNAQFLKALEVFDASDCDVLFHVQADASYDNWKQLYDDAEKYYEMTDWGIYAPNVDYTWYDSSRTDVAALDFPIDKLKIVANTDCTCWFIHKDIIDEFKARKIDMTKYKMGWGWDIVFPAIAFINKRPVIRDYNHTIEHPRGTNYDTDKAEQEMWALYNSLEPDVKQAFGYIKGDKEKLSEYYE
jgi:hypothetical protein